VSAQEQLLERLSTRQNRDLNSDLNFQFPHKQHGVCRTRILPYLIPQLSFMEISVTQDKRICLYTWRVQSLFCVSFLGANADYKLEPTSQVK